MKTTVERLQSSVTKTIEIYREELRAEKKDLQNSLLMATCVITAEPLRTRIDEIRSELRILGWSNSSRFIGTPDEWERVKGELEELNLRR